MPPVVFAIHAHPDDIEFTMAGTLLLLKERGCELHYLTIANGCCGSTVHGREETARIRRVEAREAAALLGATWHESFADDLEIFHTPPLIRKLLAPIREVRPDILLVPSPEDYMEDHQNAARLCVTAAFVRGVPNYPSDPERPACGQDVVVYHAMPHGLRTGLRQPVTPEFCADISAVIDRKEALLACHRSQKEWLDYSQGFGSYLAAMRDMSREVGRLSGRYEYAEGWRRHLHLGFSAREIDPLRELLNLS